GGTTKLAVCREGKVIETAAIDVGARVISWDTDGRVRAVTAAGERVLKRAGVRVAVDETANRAALMIVAERVAELALAVADGQILPDDLWLTEPLTTRGRFKTVVV